jgi:acetyltransferase-like isoleucine patch superfamily enzyme
MIRSWLNRLYLAGYIYRWSEIKGRLAVWLFRRLYPRFQIGSGYQIWGGFQLIMYDPQNSTFQVGRNVRMISDARRAGLTLYSPCSFRVYKGAILEIGNDVWLNGTAIACKHEVRIGDESIFAPNVAILDSDFHVHWPPEERLTGSTTAHDRPVRIGRRVWVGTGAMILKGVTIGDNAIIGAGSVVISDIPSNTLAAGNPARVIRQLADASQGEPLSEFAPSAFKGTES